MGILVEFLPMMNSTLSVKVKKTTIGDDFIPVTVYVDGDKHPAFVYSKTSGESFRMEGMWKATTELVAITEPFKGITVNDKVSVNGVEYAVDYIDDMAYMGEVMLVGLRGVS